MRGYRRCHGCERLVETARYCKRCGKCKRLDFGCCRCPTERRPTGPKLPIGDGSAISSGGADGPAIPILEDPYA